MTGSVFNNNNNRYSVESTERGRVFRAGSSQNAGINDMKQAAQLTEKAARIRALELKQKSGTITPQELAELESILGRALQAPAQQPVAQVQESTSVLDRMSCSIDWKRYLEETNYRKLVHCIVDYHSTKFELSNIEDTRKDLELAALKKKSDLQQEMLIKLAKGEKIDEIPTFEDEVNIGAVIEELNNRLLLIKAHILDLERMGITLSSPLSVNGIPVGSASAFIDRPAANMLTTGYTQPVHRMNPANLTDVPSRNGDMDRPLRTKMTPEEAAMAKARKSARRVEAGQEVYGRRYADSRPGTNVVNNTTSVTPKDPAAVDALFQEAMMQQDLEMQSLRTESSDIIQ